MSKDTGIPFCTATHNFWIGCFKISPGCKYCYFYRDYEGRYGKDPRIVKLPGNKTTPEETPEFSKPLRWKTPEVIFINSWSDFYIKEADAWRDAAWKVIENSPHFYIIITKRIERALKCLPKNWGKGYKNVIHLVSAENQAKFDFRVKKLLEIPGWRGVIAEPLLGPIDMASRLTVTFPDGREINPLHWVIIGGESGFEAPSKYQYRPCDRKLMHDIVKQCTAAKTPVFVKQMGSSLAKTLEFKGDHKGEDMTQPNWPMYLKVREYPEPIGKIMADHEAKAMAALPAKQPAEVKT